MSMVEGTDAVANETERTFGLSGTQKASAFSNAVPSAHTKHPYLVGLVLVVVGGFGLFGSITGFLPAMIGALFDPNALVNKSGSAPNLGTPTDLLTYANPSLGSIAKGL